MTGNIFYLSVHLTSIPRKVTNPIKTAESPFAEKFQRYKTVSLLYIDYNELFGTNPGNLSPTRRQTTTLKAFVAEEGSLAAAADGLSRTAKADGPSLLLMAEEKEGKWS